MSGSFHRQQVVAEWGAEADGETVQFDGASKAGEDGDGEVRGNGWDLGDGGLAEEVDRGCGDVFEALGGMRYGFRVVKLGVGG